MSARLAKTALSEMSGVAVQEIEEVWHGLKVPYLDLFAWLDGKAGAETLINQVLSDPALLQTLAKEPKPQVRTQETEEADAE